MINLVKVFIVSILLGVAAFAAAHKYFFALTDLVNNPDTQQLEIIHQLTAHDIENAIAEVEQINFSPEHPQYELLIRNYIEQYFQLVKENEIVPIKWIGIEAIRDKIFVYQQASYQKSFMGLKVRNSLLIDTYDHQINTVNYRSDNAKGSLTFNKTLRIRPIREQ
ncbi:DUF6702 family protein [Thalassotalea atypica]|uniref:DUF6702 family protein n=1 Tax=Thalassotalea atypica TaxID=2054316 RepID=UPI0025723770|nr:DUF6702 family protein [Thalassotalea atypica]